MLVTLIGTLVLAQGQTAPANPQTAAQLVSQVFSHYDSAQSISGSVLLTQAAQGLSIQIKTDLQYDKPSMMYLRQVKGATSSSPAAGWFLNSNGKTFSYSRAENVLGPDIMKERVSQNGVSQDIRQLYSAVRPALKDPNAMIEVAIGRLEDLKALKAQWATIKVSGTVTLNGVELTAITGTYRNNSAEPPSGTFEAYFDKDYNFVKYVLKQKFAVPGQIDQVISVVSTWDSDLKVNAKTNLALYTG